MNKKVITQLWPLLIALTTPKNTRRSFRMRTHYHRILWAFIFLITMLIGTYFTESTEDASYSNFSVIIYLIVLFVITVLGYLLGLYLSLWMMKVSPTRRIRFKK